jgi:hypothetical protein
MRRNESWGHRSGPATSIKLTQETLYPVQLSQTQYCALLCRISIFNQSKREHNRLGSKTLLFHHRALRVEACDQH